MSSEMVNLCLYGLIIYMQIIVTAGEEEPYPGDDIAALQSEGKDKDPWSYRRQRRPAGRKATTLDNFQAVSRDGHNSRQEMDSFVSPSPLPGNVNCHVNVDITETRRLEGECVRLGDTSTFRACRAGPYLDLFSRQCNTVLGEDGQPVTTVSTNQDPNNLV